MYNLWTLVNVFSIVCKSSVKCGRKLPPVSCLLKFSLSNFAFLLEPHQTENYSLKSVNVLRCCSNIKKKGFEMSKWHFKKLSFGNFLKTMTIFRQFLDIYMAIFRRVRFQYHQSIHIILQWNSYNFTSSGPA